MLSAAIFLRTEHTISRDLHVQVRQVGDPAIQQSHLTRGCGMQRVENKVLMQTMKL